ncbi:MAG: hypothetical protein M3R27_01175 [Bacteroidota bacterium]|nr:hypothetical protein [Bacteroidota bacterium]
MKRSVIAIICFLAVFTLRAQVIEGSRGTIKISAKKDTVYVKATTRFYVYSTSSPHRYENAYEDLNKHLLARRAVQETPLVKLVEASPTKNDPDKFDYTSFLSEHELIKKIRLRDSRADTVRLLVNIDPEGNVKFLDLTPVQKMNDTTLIYDVKDKKFYPDRCHSLTKYAFNDLLKKKWQPAKILSLKKHPSKQRKKYVEKKAYMEGVLTIIYSSDPFPET